MIKIETFKHKGLRNYFMDGEIGKLNPEHIKKLRLLISSLDASVDIRNMNFPGSGLHKLKGDHQEYWSVSVNGNWRLIFRFENGDVYDVDYLDYH